MENSPGMESSPGGSPRPGRREDWHMPNAEGRPRCVYLRCLGASTLVQVPVDRVACCRLSAIGAHTGFSDATELRTGSRAERNWVELQPSLDCRTRTLLGRLIHVMQRSASSTALLPSD